MTFPQSSLPEFKTVRTADLVRLMELLPPPDVQVGDKTMRFQDPQPHDKLAKLRDAITALVDGSRYTPPEEVLSEGKQLTSQAAEAIDLTVNLLRETARRHPEVLKDTDIEAFILNELHPAKVAANKDRTSCYGLMGLLAKARAERDALVSPLVTHQEKS